MPLLSLHSQTDSEDHHQNIDDTENFDDTAEVKSEIKISEDRHQIDAKKRKNRSADRHRSNWCKPCNRSTKRFDKHILARKIQSHRNCTAIMDLLSQHDALGLGDLNAKKEWIEKVTLLKIKWNVEHQPTGFGIITEDKDQNCIGKILCPLGCGTYVGKTYVARHRSKCQVLKQHQITNSKTRQLESTYLKDSKKVKEYITKAFSTMRRDIIFDLITTDPSFLRYWNHYFSEHMQN